MKIIKFILMIASHKKLLWKVDYKISIHSPSAWFCHGTSRYKIKREKKQKYLFLCNYDFLNLSSSNRNCSNNCFETDYAALSIIYIWVIMTHHRLLPQIYQRRLLQVNLSPRVSLSATDKILSKLQAKSVIAHSLRFIEHIPTIFNVLSKSVSWSVAYLNTFKSIAIFCLIYSFELFQYLELFLLEYSLNYF